LVLAPESSRRRIARTLNAAYADGLLSDDTFAERLPLQLGGFPPLALNSSMIRRLKSSNEDTARHAISRRGLPRR
jgi:hypothetical protein